MKPRHRFYPPKLNPTLVRLLQKTMPWLVRWQSQLELVISTEAHVQLSTLRQQPCLFLCNHPTFNDPLVMFLFSGVIGQPFYYLAAYERFQGLEGWLLQRIGAYSIRRGQADRDSVAQTLRLLAQPNCKLAIFPEGGCSFQNDTVMPFRPGAVQMALQALSKQEKQGEAADLCVVPISLKYAYTGRMQPIIEQTLQRLERALGVASLGDFYTRLRIVAAAVLGRFEQQYGLPDADKLDWNQRIVALKSRVLEQCEQQLKLTPALNEPNRERVYRIQHALEKAYTATGEEGSNGVYIDGADSWEVMRKSLSRVLNFDAIYDGYVAERPTPERFLDTLIRLEREVFNIDQPPAKGRRQAFLRVGKPVRLKDHLADYGRDRSATVTQLTQQLQQTVQRNLNVLSEATARDISW
jgi:1-acyl-sn-glycerol-3-phosphate acyltransferase